MNFKFLKMSFLSFAFLIFSQNVFAKMEYKYNENSPAYKLMQLYLNRIPKNDKKDLNMYNDFLTKLKRESIIYPENENQISDLIVHTNNLLKQNGIKDDSILNLLNLSEEIGQILIVNLHGDTKNQKLSEYLAAYLTLRKEGYSMKNARESLKDLIRSLTRVK